MLRPIVVHGSLLNSGCAAGFLLRLTYVYCVLANMTLVECWLRATFINCKINQKTREKTDLIKSADSWMINLLARTRVCFRLPGGYCCVLYPLLVIHHLGTVSATVSHSHMQRERSKCRLLWGVFVCVKVKITIHGTVNLLLSKYNFSTEIMTFSLLGSLFS